jgi:ubiquinone/menaquinone biosynthesis C-methylase UbiE
MPIDHFGLIAGFYDRLGQYRITAPLLGTLSLTQNSLLLDAGGGTGRVSTALRDLVKEVFVVDVSEGMLRRASDKGLAAVYAPVESLPLHSGSIDRIIMVDALHHVANQRQAADELWRVLAPGGRILIIEPDIRRFFVKLIAIGEKLLLMRSHFLTPEELRSLFMVSKGKVDSFVNEINVYLVVEKDMQL